MLLKKIAIQFFALFLLFGCAANKVTNKDEYSLKKNAYEQIAREKFGDNFECKLNTEKSLVLCEKTIAKPALNPNQTKEFFVFEIRNNEIIYTEKIANANVSWYNNTQLLISKQKGYIIDSKDTGKWTYIFDLKSKKKINLQLEQ